MIKPATLSNNYQIENLKQQLAQTKNSKLDFVIVAHSDDRMISRLKEAFVDKSIAVLAIPQNCWAMDEDHTSELMDWLINKLDVSGILLVGHSKGGTPTDCVQVCNSGQIENVKNDSANGGGSILDRVRLVQSSLLENEKHFRREFENLIQISAVQSARLRKKGLVQGLFYRAESGVFCVYDSEKKELQALLQTS